MNGILKQTQAEKSQERKLLWDEENRLEAIDENGFVSNYWYDAAGERTVKTSGESEQMFVNGIFSGGNTGTANFTAYVNPYIVVSKGGHYTKHIYIGSQRIVSKLGDLDSYGADPRRIEYAGNNVDGALVNYKGKYEASQQVIKNRYAIFEVPYLGIDNDDYVNGQGFCCDDTPQGNTTKAAMQNDNPELFQYYYHSDHLGSTSLITNLDGEVVQHVEYVPFGEVFIEERNNTWNTPYLFNAKELDEETGLYYYGARYYEPRTSIWLSTDPMQEKHPNYSPYIYVLCNPLRFIDIWGMTEEERTAAVNKIKTYLGTAYSKMDCSEAVDKAIRESTDIGTLKSGTGVDKANGDGKWENGVALIIGNSREVEDIQTLKVGNVVTFKSGRSDHKGEDGKFDHIGMVSELIKGEENTITGFKVVHASSSKGLVEQTYDLQNKMSGFEMKGAYRWDTPTYDGGVLPEVTVEAKGGTKLAPLSTPTLVSPSAFPTKSTLNNK